MGALGTVASTKGMNDSDYFAPFLKPGFYERFINKIGNERIRGDKNMCARNERR